jgi:glutamate formiminotransferase/formiminotetrahydrofolate cyclodeaminase
LTIFSQEKKEIMKQTIIESVPNFSEGRNPNIIKQITDTIESVPQVKLLHVDMGDAANRTVITFAGEATAMMEAAFLATKKAGELIDMRQQHGEHPRIGATDVLPLVPISGITLEETALLARQLAHRIAEEAHIPCYCYEASAFCPERKNLAVCRAGEYEALPQKLKKPETAPDYGARPFDEGIAKTGCTVVGARDFLLAVNFNINTESAEAANAIARRIREKGHAGQAGTLKATKALGWYIKEYGCAQVSMNLCDLNVTPLHTAYEEVCRQAALDGLLVTGTEIIGMVPLQTILSAGHYFSNNTHMSEHELINTAVHAMRLDALRPFSAEEKIILYEKYMK